MTRWDFIIVGSGFGGSVSALRLAEKGYRVLVLEKGKRWAEEDFPKSNWRLRKWLWNPALGLRGFFQMSFLKHVTILHGVGVGGGSLVYANTLPVPKDDFFGAASWKELADWKQELAPHYATAQQMLGAATNPKWTKGDEVLAEIAADMGRSEHHHPTEVAVYFGEPDETVPDPYFDGEGPERTGCNHCGGCMTGCRYGAKNTLDRNYLYLAEKRGVTVRPEAEVTAIRPLEGGGYRVELKPTFGGPVEALETEQLVLSGGVMGTMPLMLQMRADPAGLPNLSPRLGDFVRTNSEALFGAVVPGTKDDFSKGVAITSILHTDEHSHIEPVRYPSGSGFFRLLVLPHAPGDGIFSRAFGAVQGFFAQPLRWMHAFVTLDWARKTQILLYMRTLEGTLSVRMGRDWRAAFTRGLVTQVDDPSKAPQAFMTEATDLLLRFSRKVGGVPMSLLTEFFLGVPSTAHILGGACMGKTAEEGVIDDEHRVHGYEGMYVVDGSAVSANPGVNPSLTITALAERAMSKIAEKPAD